MARIINVGIGLYFPANLVVLQGTGNFRKVYRADALFPTGLYFPTL